MENDTCQIHIVVEGRVQGVGFRYFVLERAQELGLTGWVRNTYEGHVEVLAEGKKPVLDKFLELCRRGPRAAYVTGIDFEWGTSTGELSAFSVRSTSFSVE
jgi:acylphosphatase